MKKITSLLVFILLMSISAIAQEEDSYSKTLSKMFELSGSEESYQAAIDQMCGMFRQQYSGLESDVWDALEKEFKKTSLNDLVAMLSPVYQKYLTEEDLQGIIAFYQTPVGKKYAVKTPLIMQESMQIGQEWGMKMGQEFMDKMKEKGY